TGRKVSAKEFGELSIVRDDFHDDWKRLIKPPKKRTLLGGVLQLRLLAILVRRHMACSCSRAAAATAAAAGRGPDFRPRGETSCAGELACGICTGQTNRFRAYCLSGFGGPSGQGIARFIDAQAGRPSGAVGAKC